MRQSGLEAIFARAIAVAAMLLATSTLPAAEPVAAKGDFALSVVPASAVVIAGAETRFTVTLNSIGRFAGWIELQTLGTERARGAVGSWSVPAVKVRPGDSAKATFTLLTLLDTPAGQYPIIFQGVNGSTTHRATPVTLSITGPPQNAITATFQPNTPTVGITDCIISGHSTAGGWVTDLSTFPDGSTHSFSIKSNGRGSYTDGPFVLRQLGTYHDVLLDTETGGRQAIVYHGVGDFWATRAPSGRTLVAGQQTDFLVTFSSVSGFAGVVRPGIENAADLAGLTATWSLSSVAVRPGAPGFSRLTIKAASSLSPRILRLHVRGTNGSVARAAPDIELRVVPPYQLRR